MKDPTHKASLKHSSPSHEVAKVKDRAPDPPTRPIEKRVLMCPQDPKNLYFAEVCETIFRKSEHRPWCRKCHHFADHSQPEAKESSSSHEGSDKE